MPHGTVMVRAILFFLIFLPAEIYAADYRWTGAIDSTWTVAGNWDPSGPPGTSDTAIIDTNTVSQPVIWGPVSVYSVYIATSGVYGSTLTVNYTLTADSMVVVGQKGVITHSSNSSTKLYVSSISAGEMRVAGMINVNGKGYAGANSDAGIYTGYGPGGGFVGGSNKGGGGGSHGGGGGYGGANPTKSSIGYDSYANPSDMGSGGGTGYGTAGSGSGGSGGGALFLNISNTLQLDGYILANGGGGVAGGSHGERPGGGGGGTINIIAGSLTGGGTVQADGSNGVSGGSNGEGGGGGGGRVAIYGSTASFTGIISAYGGAKGGNVGSPDNGAAGTIFIRPPGMNGNLIVDNNSKSCVISRTMLPPADYSSSYSSVWLKRQGNLWAQYPSTFPAGVLTGDATTGYMRVDGRLDMPGTYVMSGYVLVFSSMTWLPGSPDLTVGQAGVTGAAMITNELNLPGSAGVHYASFTVNSLTIAANGSIDVSGRGYYGGTTLYGAAGNGPGGGAAGASNKGGGGGGHGGAGGYGGYNLGSGGSTYDSYYNPSGLGSGGGKYGSGTGGSGGSAVLLNVAGTLQLDGTILANGGNGVAGSSGERPGGGAGGSIYIMASQLLGGGTVQANGGTTQVATGNADGGGGGGGRVAIHASTASFTGVVSAYGGARGGTTYGPPDNGAAGTVFVKPTELSKGNLIVDNNSLDCVVARTGLPPGEYSNADLDSVQLRRKGSIWTQYPSTFTATILGDGTTGYLRVDGRLGFPDGYTLSGYGLILSSMTSLTDISGGMLDNLTIGAAGAANGAVITQEYNTFASSSKIQYASFTVNGLTIAANGSIDVSGKGYTGANLFGAAVGYGPGAGGAGASNKGGGGGGHGGAGGSGGANTGSGGISYGNFAAPSELGSGGGKYGNGKGGMGGGALMLNAGSALQFNGQILANGNNGVKGSFGECPGGGAGGSIYIIADALTGGGTVQANGGTTTAASSNADGGGGAGGRVAIYASTASFTGVIRAYGGARGGGAYGSPPAQNSGAGTVYIKPPAMDGNLIIDNNGLVPVDTCTVVIAGNYAFNSLRAVNKSSATFQGFSTVTVSGDNAFLEGDNTSTVTVGGNVYGGSFPEVYLSSFSVKWGAAGNPANANYTAEVSTYSDYSVIEKSSATYNRNAFLIDVLEPNTTYYARVKTPNYATLKLLTTNYVVIGATATWAAQPGTPANPFTGIFGTSVTVTWLGNGNPPYTEYQVQASTASDFTGTLFGPYAGPSSWNTGVSTSVISLAPCTTYYFQVKARNMNGIETGFEVLGSTTTASYFDCGLKYFDGTQVISAACVSTGGGCTGTSRLKMGKAGTIYNIGLVDPVADPSNASKMRIQTPEGIRAIRKYP